MRSPKRSLARQLYRENAFGRYLRNYHRSHLQLRLLAKLAMLS